MKGANVAHADSPSAAWPWLTKPQACALAGLSPLAFDSRVRPRMPADAIAEVRDPRHRLLFLAPAVLRACVDYERNRQRPATTGPNAGGTSPERERMYAVRREREELELAKAREQLVDASAIVPVFRKVSRTLRDAGTLLVKRYGDDAGEILNDALDEAERVVDIELGTAGGPA